MRVVLTRETKWEDLIRPPKSGSEDSPGGLLSPPQRYQLGRSGPGPGDCVLISTMDKSVASELRLYFEKHCPV